LPALASIVLGYMYHAPYWQIALLAAGIFAVFYILVFTLVRTMRRSSPARTPSPQASRRSGRNAASEQSRSSLTQGGNVELTEPCLGLSEELFRFVGERDKGDPNSTTWIADASNAELHEYSHKSVQYMNETMHLYDQKYAGRVMSLFEILEQRGLWYPKNLSSEERKGIRDPGTPYDIRAIARHLSRIGHCLDEALSQWNNEEHQTEDGQTSSEMEPPQRSLLVKSVSLTLTISGDAAGN
jgi:hypothetical protein